MYKENLMIFVDFLNHLKTIAEKKGQNEELDKKGYVRSYFLYTKFYIEEFYEKLENFKNVKKLNKENCLFIENFLNHIKTLAEENSVNQITFDSFSEQAKKYKKLIKITPLVNLGLLGEAVIVFKGEWPFETDLMYKLNQYSNSTYLLDYIGNNYPENELEILFEEEKKNYNDKTGLLICTRDIFNSVAKDFYRKENIK